MQIGNKEQPSGAKTGWVWRFDLGQHETRASMAARNSTTFKTPLNLRAH